jgi:oligopeptide transport system substrate-binding protein
MTWSRKTGLLGAVLALSVLFAVACGSDDKNESKATTAPGSPAAAATTGAAGTQAAAPVPSAQPQTGGYTALPKEQQVYKIPLTEPDYLDPHKSQFTQDIGVEKLLFRGLFYGDEKGVLQPAVAKELPTTANGGISADGKQVKVTLKDNQKWSDGSPLTAKDFEYALKRTFNPKLASPYASFAFNIVGSEEYYTALGTESKPKTASTEELNRLRDAIGVRALDDKTLQINLKEPQGTILTILSLWNMYPLKQSVVEAGGAPPESTAWASAGKLIGNGPFVLKERKEKDRIVVEANPNYSLDPKPKLTRIEFRIIDDSEVSFNAFQTGELDASAVPPSKVPVVDADANLKKLNVRGPDPTTFGLHYNNAIKPFDKKEVRVALSKAIDRDAFVKVVLAGIGEPTQIFMHPSVPGADKADGDALKYDPAAAKKLLADSGFPNGQGFPELSILGVNSAVGKAQAEFIQKALKDNLGININIDLVDSKVRSSRYSNEQYDFTVGGWHEDYHDPENWLPELFGTDGGNNQYNYSNAQFDALMKQAKFETNNEKRIALYKQGHKLMLDDGAFGPLYHRVVNSVIKSRVKGLTPNAQDAGFTGSHLVHLIELAKE